MSNLAKLVLANMGAKEKAGSAGRPGIIPRIDQVLTLDLQPDDRRDARFHPSDLSKDFCPRAWVLYNYHPEGLAVKGGANKPQLKRIFGNGHGVHSRIQGYLGANLFGTWSRPIGWDDVKKETVYEVRRHVFRPGSGWTYGEVKLNHDGDNITGHTDGLLDLDGGKDVLEVKSIMSEQFKWLVRPHDAHLIQVDIYLHCLEEMRANLRKQPLNVDDRAAAFAVRPIDGVWVLYENKDTQEMKQYYVENDHVRVEETLRGVSGRMQMARAYKAGGELPMCCCPEKKRSKLCTKLKSMPLAA